METEPGHNISKMLNDVILSLILFTTAATSESELESCILKIIDEQFDYRSILLNYNQDQEDFVINKIVKKLSNTAVIFINDYNVIPRVNEHEKWNQYVIIVNKFEDFKKQLLILQTFYNWDPKAIFLLISTNTSVTEHEIHSTVDYLWSIMIFKFFIINFIEDINKLSIITANPFIECETVTLLHIPSCNLTNMNIIFNEILKPSNIRKCNNYNAFTLIIPPHQIKNAEPDDPGVLIQFFQTIVERQKLNIFLNTSNFLKYFKEYQVNGSIPPSVLEDLSGLKNGMFIVTLNLNLLLYRLFDATDYILNDNFYWLVPAAKPLPQWENINLVFHVYVWTGLLLTFFVIACLYWFDFKFIENYFISFSDCLISSLEITLGKNNRF